MQLFMNFALKSSALDARPDASFFLLEKIFAQSVIYLAAYSKGSQELFSFEDILA